MYELLSSLYSLSSLSLPSFSSILTFFMLLGYIVRLRSSLRVDDNRTTQYYELTEAVRRNTKRTQIMSDSMTKMMGNITEKYNEKYREMSSIVANMKMEICELSSRLEQLERF